MKGCYHTEKAVTDGQTDRQTDGRQERVLELELCSQLIIRPIFSEHNLMHLDDTTADNAK